MLLDKRSAVVLNKGFDTILREIDLTILDDNYFKISLDGSRPPLDNQYPDDSRLFHRKGVPTA